MCHGLVGVKLQESAALGTTPQSFHETASLSDSRRPLPSRHATTERLGMASATSTRGGVAGVWGQVRVLWDGGVLWSLRSIYPRIMGATALVTNIEPLAMYWS